MAIDPNAFNHKDSKKLVVDGLDFRWDGSMSLDRLETNGDPGTAERGMQTVRETAKNWRELHRKSQLTGLTYDEKEVRRQCVEREKAELLAAFRQLCRWQPERPLPHSQNLLAAWQQGSKPTFRRSSLNPLEWLTRGVLTCLPN